MKPRYPDLKTYLTDTDTTQEQLATRLGISQAHMSMIIRGQRKPSYDLALDIEAKTGVPFHAIVGASA